MNEKGYSLVLTLLIVTIFFMLGLTILSVSLYQAKFTQTRVEDVTSLHEATKAIEETIAEIKVKIEGLTLTTPLQLDVDLGNSETGFIKQLTERYGVNIQDVTSDNNIDRTKLFTRVYLLSKPYGTKTVWRKIIITNTPSFLKYAVGSRKDVTLNGGAYIDGNIYTGNDFYLTNTANYIYNSLKYSKQTSFPTTSKTSILFVNGNRYVCDHENGAKACYDLSSSDFMKNEINFTINPSTLPFQYTGPVVQKEQEEFIDVNFDFTLKDKLLSAAGINSFNLNDQEQYKSLIQLDIPNLVTALKGKFAVIHDIQDLPNAINSGKSILFEGYGSPYLDLTSLHLNDDQWLIVSGDVFLENSGTTPLNLKGNIIILGNLDIRGNVAFDATIYVDGNTSIYNAVISGLNGKEVVILTKGELQIARINEFQNNFSLTTPNLKGFFYTDSNAIIYAVGSYINIQGGLFANGTEQLIPDTDSTGLVINAYRGATADTGTNISFTPPLLPEEQQAEQARFVVKHDMNVFINRGLGLPLVKKLALIPDKLQIK
ncbi:hypothetical protein [Anoxybacteroides amylolyticum]|uniref:Uncharacterized protein n=1 Tax=Anoxybacteroides amylolyticum TaxID=294699 RepID=A0A160F5U9_9BACL|nr:hypothetical protein [Anoxybacillus amylolyticus]ANB61531.1 hypothetical protein GFC30_2890 [Anoxybacillus amylolyticus]